MASAEPARPGARRARRPRSTATWSPSSSSARPSVTTARPGGERRLDEERCRPPRPARRPSRSCATSRSTTKSVALSPRTRRGVERELASPARARRRRCAPRRSCRPGSRAPGRGRRSRSAPCASPGSAAGARRVMVAGEVLVRSRRRATVDRRPRRDDVEVDLRRVGGHAHGAAIDDGDDRRSPGARTRPGSTSRCATSPSNGARRTQSLTSSELPGQRAPVSASSCASSEALCAVLLLDLVGRDEAAVEQPLRARGLVGDAPSGARRWRARAPRSPWSTALALRQSSVASTSPRLTTAPGRTSTVST